MSSREARVLVVEDDEDIALVLQRSLRMEGYEVRVAADGEAALDEARAFTPTSSSSTSACRSSTAWRSPAGCAEPTTSRS